MMDNLPLYAMYAMAIVGAASAAAKVLKPLVEWTKNTWDNKLVNGITWVADKLLPLLDGVALNPKALPPAPEPSDEE